MTLLVLAIDALDSDLIRHFLPRLPNIARLISSGVFLDMETTFPPDSDTAWATAMTGLSPAEHGVVRFVDPLRKSFEILNRGSDNESLAGNTFFDDAAAANRKVLAVFPHLGHPLWPSKSCIVARASSSPIVDSRPEAYLAEYPDPPLLAGVRGFPGRGQAEVLTYLHRVTRQARADSEFGLRLLKREPWDLAFMYWSAIDAIGHFFWSYFDGTEAPAARVSTLGNAIPETYELFDDFVGSFLNEVGPKADVILMSDHGHAGRPATLLNVNELLRRNSLLTTRSRVTAAHLHVLERTKRQLVRAVSRYGLARHAGRALRMFPGSIETFTRPAVVDWGRTIAYGSDMSGIKPYEYGGILVNRDALHGRQYEHVREEVIELLSACQTSEGVAPVARAFRREDLHQGPHLDRYPDILVQMNRGYGLGWAVHGQLFGSAPGASLVPGSHRSDTSTFIARTTRSVRGSTIDIRDVRASIADLLQVTTTTDVGRSIFLPR